MSRNPFDHMVVWKPLSTSWLKIILSFFESFANLFNVLLTSGFCYFLKSANALYIDSILRLMAS